MDRLTPRVVGLGGYGEDEDDLRTREVLGYTVEARNPHGFWFILKAKHPKLKSAFTTLSAAERAIREVQAEEEKSKKEVVNGKSRSNVDREQLQQGLGN